LSDALLLLLDQVEKKEDKERAFVFGNVGEGKWHTSIVRRAKASAAAAPRVIEQLPSDDTSHLSPGTCFCENGQQYDQSATLDGRPSVALSIYQLPGSNALETARGVYAKMKELKNRFPEGVDYEIVYDTTPLGERPA